MGVNVIASHLPAVLPMCSFGDIGCYTGEAAQSAFQSIVEAIGEGVVTMITFLSTFWLDVPSPDVAVGAGPYGSGWATADEVSQMQRWISPATAAVAAISFAIAIMRIAFSGQAGEARLVIRQVAAVAAGSTAVAAATQILIQGGDAFSPWIISQAAGGRSPSDGLKTLIGMGFADGHPADQFGLWFVVFLLCSLGAIIQCAFMLVRAAALVVLMVFVPPIAAGTASEEGWARFKRLGLIIVGFALYKPVAAIIYAVGIMQMTQNTNGTSSADVKNALYGLTIMVMAALALPAFIKFLLPMAAMGSSSAFSGAAAAGVVAAGAAVVATGGWGASGAAGSAGASGASGTSGLGGATGAGATAPAAPAGAAGAVARADTAGAGPAGGRAIGGIAGSVQSGAAEVNGAEPEEAA